MFEDALNYPRESDDALKNVVVGSLLILFSVLVLPVFLLFGYYLRVLRASLRDEPVPSFAAWEATFVDGLKAFLVTVAYLLVPAIVFGASVGSAIGAALSGDVNAVTGAVVAGALLGTLVASVLGLVAWYVLPAALAALASTERIGAAFSWAHLRPALFDGSYAVAWVLALVVFVVVSVVTGVLNAIPFGFVLGIPVMFYATVVAFNLYGRGVAASVEPEIGAESVEGDRRPVV